MVTKKKTGRPSMNKYDKANTKVIHVYVSPELKQRVKTKAAMVKKKYPTMNEFITAVLEENTKDAIAVLDKAKITVVK